MPLLESDIVVSPSDIELGKDFCMTKPTNDVSDKREWVSVFDGVFIELAVVLYKS